MSIPQHHPTPRELDDLELLLTGALAPHTGFTKDGPLTLALPEGITEAELVDPEGLPLAEVHADGSLTSLAPASGLAYGAFRRLHLSPAQTKASHPGALTVPVAAPLTWSDLREIASARKGQPVVLLALTGTGTPQGVTAIVLIRACLVAAKLIGNTHVVAVPLASHGDATVDHELGQLVAANYASADVLALTGEGEVPDEVQDVIDQGQPDEPGVVVFFTGLSGSGKSTLARALHDLVLEEGERTVTSLDGDVVRRNLSKGLTFSKEDRETNILRIGWVAAEIARHGGLAIVSPIAPFDATRKAVRAMVEDAGGEFVLIHVATPLEECERRDRKGLYAKARAGEIPEFTGISSPYEVPTDATAVVDTTGRTIEAALADVLEVLPFDVSASPEETSRA